METNNDYFENSIERGFEEYLREYDFTDHDIETLQEYCLTAGAELFSYEDFKEKFKEKVQKEIEKGKTSKSQYGCYVKAQAKDERLHFKSIALRMIGLDKEKALETQMKISSSASSIQEFKDETGETSFVLLAPTDYRLLDISEEEMYLSDDKDYNIQIQIGLIKLLKLFDYTNSDLYAMREGFDYGCKEFRYLYNKLVKKVSLETGLTEIRDINDEILNRADVYQTELPKEALTNIGISEYLAQEICEEIKENTEAIENNKVLKLQK